MKQLRIPGTGQTVGATLRKMVPYWLPGWIRDEFKAAAQSDCQCRGCKAIRVHREYDLYSGAGPLRSQQLRHLNHSSYDCQCHFTFPNGRVCGAEIRTGDEVMWDPSHGAMQIAHFTSEQIDEAKARKTPRPSLLDVIEQEQES